MVTLIIMVAVSMMSAKFATLAFLKLKILAHAIPSAARLPRVWTRYSHDYTKPGSGQSRTRDAAKQHCVNTWTTLFLMVNGKKHDPEFGLDFLALDTIFNECSSELTARKVKVTCVLFIAT